MSDANSSENRTREDRGPEDGTPGSLYGLLAEFSTPETLFKACEKVRDRGLSHWDAHTPFPIHGLEKAMGLKRSPGGPLRVGSGLGGRGFGHAHAVVGGHQGLSSGDQR